VGVDGLGRHPPHPPAGTSPPPLVSVVVPATRADLLAEALRSVGEQRRPPSLEVVVAHDGGAPLALPEHLPPSGAPVLSLGTPWRRPAGPGATRNWALRHARGLLVAFLDDDDLWLPDHLARTVPLARAVRGLVFTDTLVEDLTTGRTAALRLRFAPEVLRRTNPIVISSAVVPRSRLEGVGGFDPTLRRYEDWDLFLRLAGAGVPIVRVPEPTVRYRYSARSLSHDRAAAMAAFAAFCAKHGLADLPQGSFADLLTGEAWRDLREE
jgi:hypothetical protein